MANTLKKSVEKEIDEPIKKRKTVKKVPAEAVKKVKTVKNEAKPKKASKKNAIVDEKEDVTPSKENVAKPKINKIAIKKLSSKKIEAAAEEKEEENAPEEKPLGIKKISINKGPANVSLREKIVPLEEEGEEEEAVEVEKPIKAKGLRKISVHKGAYDISDKKEKIVAIEPEEEIEEVEAEADVDEVDEVEADDEVGDEEEVEEGPDEETDQDPVKGKKTSKDEDFLLEPKPRISFLQRINAKLEVATKEEAALKQEQKKEVINEVESKRQVLNDFLSAQQQVNQIEKPKTAITKPGVKDRSLHLYRKISFSFIFFALVFFAASFYFFFFSVTIKVAMKEQSINENMVADIYHEENANSGSSAKDNALPGIVKEIELEQSKEFQATGKNVTGAEAVGKIKLINNYNKSQPLVATTRVLSSEGKLFRLKDTVNIPASGSVEVDIYADEPNQESAIGPSKFTIPGLWAGLQDKIYGETSEAIKYQEKATPFIQQIDIDKGVDELKKALTDQAKNQVEGTYKQKYNQVLFEIDANSISSEVSNKVSDEVASFTVKLKVKVEVVAFNDDGVKKLAEDKLRMTLSQDKQLVSLNKDGMKYSLNTFNAAQGVASINVVFEGEAKLKNGTMVDKNKLIGLTDQQLNKYLSSQPEIEKFEIRYSPSFMKKVPDLPDKISIEPFN